MRGLAIGLGATRNVHIEQMNFVVTRDAFAAVVIHERGGGDTTVAGYAHRHGARDDPEPELTSGAREKVLNRAVAVGFAHGALVGVLQTHERKIFRKRGQRGALLSRLPQKRAGLREIRGDLGPGGHLQGSHLHLSTPSWKTSSWLSIRAHDRLAPRAAQMQDHAGALRSIRTN